MGIKLENLSEKHYKVLDAHRVKDSFSYESLIERKKLLGLTRDDSMYSELMSAGYLESGQDTKGWYVICTKQGLTLLELLDNMNMFPQYMGAFDRLDGTTGKKIKKLVVVISRPNAKYNF